MCTVIKPPPQSRFRTVSPLSPAKVNTLFPLQSLGTTNGFSVPVVLPFLGCKVNEIIPYVEFLGGWGGEPERNGTVSFIGPWRMLSSLAEKAMRGRGFLPLPILLAFEPLRLNLYVSGGEGLKGIALFLLGTP